MVVRSCFARFVVGRMGEGDRLLDAIVLADTDTSIVVELRWMSFTPGLIEALRQGKGRLSAVELAGIP